MGINNIWEFLKDYPILDPFFGEINTVLTRDKIQYKLHYLMLNYPCLDNLI